MTLNELNESDGFELGAALETGSKDSNAECGSPVVETGGVVDANECVNMTLNETNGFELGAALEIGSKDSNFKCGSPVVETGVVVDANEETYGFELGTTLESGVKDSTVKCGSPVVETGGADASMLTSTFNANLVNDDCAEEKTMEDGQIQAYEADQLKSPPSMEEKVSQNSLSRERRKSKYLSPPFVDLSKGAKALSNAAEIEVNASEKPGNKSNNAGKSSSLVKCARKTKSRKSLTGSAGFMPIPAADLFTQIHVMARDCHTPHRDRAFDGARVFFTRFRASHFSGIELIGEAGTEDEENANANVNDSSAHVQKQAKTSVRKMKREKRMTGPDKTPFVNANVSSALCPVMGPKPQRKRKKNNANQTAGIPDLNGNNNNGEPAKKRRMRKKGTNSTIPSTIPGISLEVCLHVSPEKEPTPTEPVPNTPENPTGVPISSTPTKQTLTGVPNTPEKPIDVPKQPLAGGANTPEKPTPEPSLDQMKQSLEFMTSMLEKSGNLISPEMRANLESEIQKLLKKVNPMVSPSS